MRRRNFVKLFTLSFLSVFTLNNVLVCKSEIKKTSKPTAKNLKTNIFGHSLDAKFHI